MKPLDRYLAATRIGREDAPSALSVLHYRRLARLCRGRFRGATLRRLKVAIVYTLNRYSEIVALPGGHTLIYDQHAGQVLSTFTRIMRFAEDPRAGERVFMRILAEESLAVGDPHGAQIGYSFAEKFAPYWTVAPIASDPEVVIEVLLQEMFVFAHEYCHLAMAGDAKFAESRRRVGDLLTNTEGEESRDKGEYKAFGDRYGDVETYDAFVASRRAQRARIAQHREALLSELGCDDFALWVLISICGEEGYAPKLAFRAAFLALRNIRTISYIREAVSPIKAIADVGGGEAALLLQIRQHRLRGVFGVVAQGAGLTEELNAFWAELQDLSDLHDQKIDNPVLFGTIPTFAEARNTLAESETNLIGPAGAWEIAERGGWRPHAAKLHHLVV